MVISKLQINSNQLNSTLFNSRLHTSMKTETKYANERRSDKTKQWGKLITNIRSINVREATLAILAKLGTNLTGVKLCVMSLCITIHSRLSAGATPLKIYHSAEHISLFLFYILYALQSITSVRHLGVQNTILKETISCRKLLSVNYPLLKSAPA